VVVDSVFLPEKSEAYVGGLLYVYACSSCCGMRYTGVNLETMDKGGDVAASCYFQTLGLYSEH
jgi:hypothetical protein